METKDLMMGDWIQSPITPKPLKVAQINWDYSVECVGIDDMIRYHVGLGDIKPIPLTPEILEKNGFGYTEESEYYIHYYLGKKNSCKIGLHIGTDKMGNYWINTSRNDIFGLRYIHELQHALRLCGIEKEIII